MTTASAISSRARRGVLRLVEGRAWLYILGVVFRLLLELAYKDFVVPVYESYGFLLVDRPEKYLESWVIYLALLVFLPAKARKPSDFLLCLAFFGYITPLLVFYGFADASQWALYCVLAQYGIMSLLRLGRPLRLPAIKYGSITSSWLATGGIVIATIWMVASGALSNFSLNLNSVYLFREDASNALNVGVLSYVIVWVTTVCGPIVLMLALRDGRRMLALGIILLHVFWFGVTTHKAVLFYPLLVVFLNFLFKRSTALSLLPLGMSFAVLVSLASYYATSSLFLSGLFVRRVFFIPSQLTFTYYEFFELNPFVYWSNSFLSGVFDYPYEESVGLVIGKYLNEQNASANNSFFSTGYMQAGLLGVVIYGLAAGALMKFLDSLVTREVPLWMSLSVVIVPFYIVFTSADLTTALLTHGLGFALFMLYLMKPPREARTKPGPVLFAAQKVEA